MLKLKGSTMKSSWMISHVNVKEISDIFETVYASIFCYSPVAELYI
jgi:hypothetical protein